MSAHSHDHDDDDDDAGLHLTILCWIGLALATLDAFVQPLPQGLVWAALGLSYLAGGIPPLRTAMAELRHDRRLDIDLLMVVAAVAAASVGAVLEGAVLLALFSLSHTLEHRSMGKARRAVEALMQLGPETALRKLAAARALASRTAGIIRQNLAISIGAMVTLVAGSLFLALPLQLAVLGHEGGTVLVVLNGLRLLADPIRARV